MTGGALGEVAVEWRDWREVIEGREIHSGGGASDIWCIREVTENFRAIGPRRGDLTYCYGGAVQW